MTLGCSPASMCAFLAGWEAGVLGPELIVLPGRGILRACSKEWGCGALGVVKANARVYRSLEELPEVVEPGRSRLG